MAQFIQKSYLSNTCTFAIYFFIMQWYRFTASYIIIQHMHGLPTKPQSLRSTFKLIPCWVTTTIATVDSHLTFPTLTTQLCIGGTTQCYSIGHYMTLYSYLGGSCCLEVSLCVQVLLKSPAFWKFLTKSATQPVPLGTPLHASKNVFIPF